jgi:adenine-specific DNA-methyltransferase
VPDSSKLAAQLDSLPRLLGAAVSLDAESVAGVSAPEKKLIRSTKLEVPERQFLIALRSAIREGQDPLGDAFCLLRDRTERRAVGATYTPSRIVDVMVGWAADGPDPDRIIDPGAGSGRFSLRAGRQFRHAQVIAVELDPVAAILCRANLAAAGLADRATVEVNDYRAFNPKQIDGHSLYLGNPPYVRHHQIGLRWKQWLVEEARKQGLESSQLAGLHVHFFLATVRRAAAGDRGSFITSAEWLDVNYGRLVRELVLDGLGGQSIHVIEPEAEPFEDAQTTASVTCFEIGERPDSVRLRRVKSVAHLKSLSTGAPIRRERLAEARRWTPLTRTARKPPAGYIELGELARVHRGAVTGANRVWIVDPAAIDLPREVLFPAVTRAQELFGAGTTLGREAKLRSVIDLPRDLDLFDGDERKAIDRFLRRARRLDTHRGYIARHRKCWWSIGLREPAPILATYMARRRPAIVRNVAEARHVNIAHGVYPREQLSKTTIRRLAAAIRDSVTLGDGRTYAGGLVKFEPREFERLLIPDVTQPAA